MSRRIEQGLMISHRLRSLLKARIPILRWLPRYTGMDATSDLVAGLTVGMTLIAQAIAYAALAGLDPQVGRQHQQLQRPQQKQQ